MATASDLTAPAPETTPVATTVVTTTMPSITASPAPVITSAEDSDTGDPDTEVGDLATEVDFKYDEEDRDDNVPLDYVVGRDIASGVWQWSRLSANDCVFIAVAPEPWSWEPGEPARDIYDEDVEFLWWLDARELVALATGEAIVGYSSNGGIDGMVSGISYPECFLERIGDNIALDEEIYAQRHDSGSGGVEGGEYLPHEESELPDVPDDGTGWQCRAHTGPEPVDRLDWRHVRYESSPEVSCVVGMGILPGWWQWHQFSAPSCIYVVVDTGDELDQALHPSQRRRDAREPIPLREGEIVKGYSDNGREFSRFIAATSHPECFLEHIAPEDQPPA